LEDDLKTKIEQDLKKIDMKTTTKKNGRQHPKKMEDNLKKMKKNRRQHQKNEKKWKKTSSKIFKNQS
jgi:hypothetical protein